jgi:hypothetical protein
MSWTVTRITDAIRNLTGKQSTSQISDADILLKINDFYQLQLPVEIQPPELRGWCETVDADGGSSALTDGTREYVMPDTVASIYSPCYLHITDGSGTVTYYRISLYNDPGEFYNLYPEDMTEENVPDAVMVIDRGFVFGPIPDSTYAIKFRCWNKPTALTSGAPTNDAWGPLIVYGTAINLMYESAQVDEANKLAGMYKYHKHICIAEKLRSIPVGHRAMPRF